MGPLLLIPSHLVKHRWPRKGIYLHQLSHDRVQRQLEKLPLIWWLEQKACQLAKRKPCSPKEIRESPPYQLFLFSHRPRGGQFWAEVKATENTKSTHNFLQIYISKPRPQRFWCKGFEACRRHYFKVILMCSPSPKDSQKYYEGNFKRKGFLRADHKWSEIR